MSFLWGHWYPCFGLLMMSALGFKARVDFLLVCFLACVLFLRFTSVATPANVLTARMPARCIPYMLSRGRILGFEWVICRSFCSLLLYFFFGFSAVFVVFQGRRIYMRFVVNLVFFLVLTMRC